VIFGLPAKSGAGVVIDFVRCEAKTGHRPIAAIRMTVIPEANR